MVHIIKSSNIKRNTLTGGSMKEFEESNSFEIDISLGNVIREVLSIIRSKFSS